MLTKQATAGISNFLATVAVKAAAENTHLAPHVVKDLQQQAQQQSQARGGVTDPSKIKQPGSFNPYLTGSLIGAGAGGLVGLLGETRKKKKDRNYLRSVLGTGLAGAGLGLGLGALPTALQNIRDAQTGTPSIGGIGGGPSGGADGSGGSGGNLGTSDSYYQSDDLSKRIMQDLGIGSLFGAGLSRTGLRANALARDAARYTKDTLAARFGPTSLLRQDLPKMYGSNTKYNLVGAMPSDTAGATPFTKQVEKMVNVFDPATNKPVLNPGDFLKRPKVNAQGTPMYDKKGRVIMEMYKDPATNDWARAPGTPKQELRMVNERIPFDEYVKNIATSPQAMTAHNAAVAQAKTNLKYLELSGKKISQPVQYAADKAKYLEIINADKLITGHVVGNRTAQRTAQQKATSEWLANRPGGGKAFVGNTILGAGFAEGGRMLLNKLFGMGY